MRVSEKTAADQVRELVQGHTLREIVWQPVRGKDGVMRRTMRVHTVVMSGLLDQLENTIATNTAAGGDMVRPAPGSRPAGRLHVLAFLGRVEAQSTVLAAAHGLPVLPLRERLARLGGAIGDTPHPVVKAWWATARILTCHDSPPFTPNVHCPNEHCDRRGTLRVRVEEDAQDRTATCVECGMLWAGAADFGMLARWVEWAAEHLNGPRHWVGDTEEDPDVTGYGEALGYVVVCGQCEPWRAGMVERDKARRAKEAA